MERRFVCRQKSLKRNYWVGGRGWNSILNSVVAWLQCASLGFFLIISSSLCLFLVCLLDLTSLPWSNISAFRCASASHSQVPRWYWHVLRKNLVCHQHGDFHWILSPCGEHRALQSHLLDMAIDTRVGQGGGGNGVQRRRPVWLLLITSSLQNLREASRSHKEKNIYICIDLYTEREAEVER